MKDVYLLKDWKQVRALADPSRLRALEAFCRGPRTAKQMALLLGEKPAKLYHDVEVLEKLGLIQLVETRPKRGTLEKYYRAVADEFVVDRKLLEITKGADRGTTGYEKLLLAALEAALAEARRTVAAKLITPLAQGRNALIFRHHYRGTRAQLERLLRKIHSWIKECQALDLDPGEADYSLTIAFYPVEGRRRARRPRRK